MDFYEKSLNTLELPAVLQMLAAEAVSDGAKEAALKLLPSDDKHEVKRRLDETSSAKTMMVVRGSPSFSGVKDVRASLSRADLGGSLNTLELLSIAKVLQCSRLVKAYIADDAVGKTTIDYLFSALHANRFLEEKITSSIVGEDEIADSASPELANIRRKIRAASARVRDSLQKIISSPSYAKALQEPIITMRSDRFVVPVKAEHKGAIPGLVHDISSSGATLFIEPMGAVKANNELRELAAKEKTEIERILAELSAECAEHANDISSDYNLLIQLDLIFAKAKLSYKLDCSQPELREKGIVFRNARHPLLQKGKAVPISLELGEDFDTLVITGPNTGGKTVTLKTIGLLNIMAQCGLHIPAEDGSGVPVYKHILADIGDEQSIEQNLSTFSAHMTNIVHILAECGEGSLLLFDELGAGTDPTEGAALAIAVIENARQRGATIAATTHYAELKVYATSESGIQNASCEFDVETLRPTYRLLVGIPGKSNAFAISLRLGIPEHIIERAKAVMSDDNVRFEDVITRLQDTESRLSKEKKNAEQLKAEAEKKLAEAETLRKVAEEEAAKAVQKAKEQANRILISAKASSEYILDEVNELKRKAEKEKNFDTLEEARRSIRKTLKETNVESEEAPEDDYVPPRPFRVGDTVMIAGINKEAYITALDGDSATVQAGIIKTKVKTSELRLKDKPVQQQPKKTTLSVSRNSAPAKQEIDVRGQTGDDAYFMIDRFFDSAIMANYHVVTIIHGKGTGALRAAIWAKLRKDKRVKSFRSGSYGEGDFGVTVVEL